MRKALLGAGLLAGVLTVLWIGSLGFSSATGEAKGLEVNPAALLLRLESHPSVRPWLNRLVQLAQDNPALARRFGNFFGGGLAAQAAPGQTYRLTFPHVANGTEAGLTIRLNVIVINNSGADGTGRILFRTQSGSPMRLATNLGTASEFTFALLPGQVLRLETSGTGPLQLGWVEVVSDIELAGSGTFSVLDGTGTVLSEVGIGDSARADELMIFVDTTEGRNTGIGICNPDSSKAANLTYELRRLDGSVVASVTGRLLNPLNQKAEFVTEVFQREPVDLTDFKGVLLVKSPNVEVSLITLRTRGVNFTSLRPARKRSGSQGSDRVRLYFARMGDGVFGTLGFQSSVILLNHSPSPITAAVEFFAEDGSPLSVGVGDETATRFEVGIPAGGGTELLTDGESSPGVTGWARVSSGSELDGSATFTIADRKSGSFVSEVGVPDSPMTSDSVVSAREMGPVGTGIGLTNPEDTPVTVRLRLMGGTAQAAPADLGLGRPAEARPEAMLAETFVELPPFGHTGRFVAELFSDVQLVRQRNFEGRLEIAATVTGTEQDFAANVSAIALLTRGPLLTSLPTPQLTTNFRPLLTLSAATYLPGATPALCLAWRQEAGEFPVQSATIRVGAGNFNSADLNPVDRLGRFTSVPLFLLYSGDAFVEKLQAESISFFPLVTFDGISEAMPYSGEIIKLPGGGIEVRIENNSVNLDPHEFFGKTTFCLDPGLFAWPDVGSLEIPVSEFYQSVEDPEGIRYSRTVSGVLRLLPKPSAGPEIHFVTPHRVVAGDQIQIRGRGFSPSAGGNRVRLVDHPDLPLEVESASANLLTVRLPARLPGRELAVEVQGNRSNSYRVDRAFAGAPTVELSSRQRGQAVRPRIRVELALGDLGLDRFEVDPSAGEWILEGFADGQVAGFARLSALGFEAEGEEYELKVKAGEPGSLTLVAFDEDETQQFEVVLTNQGPSSFIRSPGFFPGLTLINPIGLTFEFDFVEPVFRLPNASGTNVRFEFRLISLPDRAGKADTSLQVESVQAIITE